MGEMIRCPACQKEFSEQLNTCPHCGKYQIIQLHDAVMVNDFLGVKAKREGEKRPFIEQRSGIRHDERRPGCFVREERTINRDVPDGEYHHVLEKLDRSAKPTGEPIHEEHETLKEHNRKKRRRDDQ